VCVLATRFNTVAVFYALLLDTGRLYGDIYVNTALSMLLEIPCLIANYPLVNGKVNVLPKLNKNHK